MTVLFVAYGMAGGLEAAIVTDFIQGILIIVFSFLLLPFILHKVGGLSGIRAAIPDPDKMFSLVAPGQIGIFYIVVIAFNALVGITAQPHVMGNCAAGRTEMEGRVGFMGGTMIKRVCTIAWSLTGLAAVVYFSGQQVEPDDIYGLAARNFLPLILPGLLGLFLAALVASVMSTCDSLMVASAGLFTENVCKQVIPGKGPGHYLLVGRIAALVVVVGGVLFALLAKGVVEMLEVFWKISAMMGIVFWLGLFWRRTTVSGAWAATVVGFATWYVSGQQFFLEFLKGLSPVAGLPWVTEIITKTAQGLQTSYEIYLPWQMVFYLSMGTLAGILVSVWTKPVGKEKLDQYYALARTPISPGEVVTQPCTLPADAVVPPRRNLVSAWGLEIPIPLLVSVYGFLFGWAFVASIIALFIYISRG